jgi:hypothetical protein
MKRIVLGFMGIIALLLIGLVVYPFWSVRPSWPDLKEEQKTQLLELASSVAGSEDRELSANEMNEPLKELRPHGVWVEDGVLVVLLSGGGIHGGWGYLISHEEKEVRGYPVLRSKDSRFKRFFQDN